MDDIFNRHVKHPMLIRKAYHRFDMVFQYICVFGDKANEYKENEELLEVRIM